MAKTPESANPNLPENAASKTSTNGGPPQQLSGGQTRSVGLPENTMPKASGNGGASEVRASGESSTSGSQSSAAHTVSERKGQYLIAARRLPGIQPMGLQPLQFSVIEQTLRSSPDIEVVDTVGPKNIMGALSDGLSDVPTVLVARMTEQKAAVLHQQAQGRLIIERDQALNLLEPAFQQPALVAGATPTTGPVLATVITVLGKDNAPVKDAEVYLFGSLIPATGTTDEQGQVTLSLFGETEQSIRGLYVKPKADYWSFYQSYPEISTREANVVGLRPLSDWSSLPNFPKQQSFGWGQKAMRLDQLPGTYRGQGIKIAVVDSGAATTHDDLRKIRFGFDVINKKTNPNTWNEDTVAHGSHCAGIIAGADNSVGVRGFAPDAEIHVCKLFPGGQISQLIDALEYCIEKQIDVVNLSLGGAEPSEALEQQILRAKRAGVACIVAAGNSGGAVQYPACSPNVLAVSAIGRINEFPTDSYHSQTVTAPMDVNGFFAAKFSCFGPEIAVCAPGVAITSSVPPNNYAVWDGTSMAAPHVTGLAALVLAHHPDFQATFRVRGAERVERLFQIIKLSARRVNLGDPRRTGFGLPDVLVAVGLQPQAGIHPMAAANLPGILPQQHAFAANLYPFAGAEQQAQLAPQNWLGNPWAHSGGQQQLANQALGLASIDPAYAAYMPSSFSQPYIGGAPISGFGFGGIPHSGFGRIGW